MFALVVDAPWPRPLHGSLRAESIEPMSAQGRKHINIDSERRITRGARSPQPFEDDREFFFSLLSLFLCYMLKAA